MPLYENVSIVPVLIATLINLVLGFVWYSLIFKKCCHTEKCGVVKGSNGKLETTETPVTTACKAPCSPYCHWIGAVIVAFLYAWIFNALSNRLEAFTTPEGLKLGLGLWLGFILPILLSGFIWEHKSTKWLGVNAGFWLVSSLLVGFFYSYWS